MESLPEKKENEELHNAQPPFSKFKIIKNAVILSLVFFIEFIAYDCLSMLQSTLNHEKGLGVICQALVYGCFCISSLLLPKYVIQRLGCKVTLLLSMFLYIPYTASNLYPHFSFMVPTAILNGFAASLLWGSQCQYLNEIAVLYAKLGNHAEISKEDKESQYKQGFDNNKRVSNVDTEIGDTKEATGDGKCVKSTDDGICNNEDKEKVIQNKSEQVFDNSTCSFNADTVKRATEDGECLESVDYKEEKMVFEQPEQVLDESMHHTCMYIETDDGKETSKDGEYLYCDNCLNKDHERYIPNQCNQHSDEMKSQLSMHTAKEYVEKYVKDDSDNHEEGFDDLNIQNRYKQIPDVNMCFSSMLEEMDCKTLKKRMVEEDSNILFTNSLKGSDFQSETRNFYYDDIVNYTSSKNSLSLVATSKNKDILSKNIQSVTARFFGVFGMAFLSTHMFSNVMSYFILEKGVSYLNITLDSSCKCGAQFCNDKSDCLKHNLLEPSQENRNLLIGICVGLSVASILILALFLDSLNDKKQNVKFSLELFMATTKHLKRKKQILLTPISFYIGMLQGFYTGDFNMSFVGCAWGTFHVGLVSICYGAACGIASPLSGYMVKQVGRIPVFMFGTLINIGGQVVLLIWTPSVESSEMFFVIAALWGIALGIFWSQVKAIYGFLFKDDEEVAFAAYHLWYSLGYCLSFAYSNYLCTYIKIYVLIGFFILGITGYLCLEILCKLSK